MDEGGFLKSFRHFSPHLEDSQMMSFVQMHSKVTKFTTNFMFVSFCLGGKEEKNFAGLKKLLKSTIPNVFTPQTHKKTRF